jgi:adenosylcobinamide-GDP ribazoletransferase
MYSKIPMPKIEWNNKNMKYALCFFPLVGFVIGIAVYGVGQLGYYYQWNPLLFAAIMTLMPVMLTGGIHLDGLLDTIDALSAYCEQEKRLEILKDSNSGAFAIIGGIFYFILSLGIWSATPKEVLGILFITYGMSRTMSAFSMATFPLAKNTGLVATFQQGAQIKIVQIVMGVLYIAEVIAMIIINPIIGISCTFGSLLVFAYHYYVCKKYFGGITGDLAGYFLQICELIMLIIVTLLGNIIL